MEKYNETVAKNPKVEMIHVSLDRDEDAAEEWAASAGLPWLTILMKDKDKSGFGDFKSTNFVPEYVLISRSGEKIGSGSGVYDQIKGLTK